MKKVLDLFGGVGGAGAGYNRAGMEVIGVDIAPQPDYPYYMIVADALEYVRMLGTSIRMFDLIHASPPCQASSALTKGTNRVTRSHHHVDLIAPTRELLDSTGVRYVLENVQGAKMRRDMTLCGEMFGLDVIRHRYFELGGWKAKPPAHVKHRGRVSGWRHGTFYPGPYVAVYGDGGGKGSVEEWQDAMDIHWTSERKSIAEAIPPAYTEYIGNQFVAL